LRQRRGSVAGAGSGALARHHSAARASVHGRSNEISATLDALRGNRVRGARAVQATPAARSPSSEVASGSD